MSGSRDWSTVFAENELLAAKAAYEEEGFKAERFQQDLLVISSTARQYRILGVLDEIEISESDYGLLTMTLRYKTDDGMVTDHRILKKVTEDQDFGDVYRCRRCSGYRCLEGFSILRLGSIVEASNTIRNNRLFCGSKQVSGNPENCQSRKGSTD